MGEPPARPQRCERDGAALREVSRSRRRRIGLRGTAAAQARRSSRGSAFPAARLLTICSQGRSVRRPRVSSVCRKRAGIQSFSGRLSPGSDCHAGAGHGLQIRRRMWQHNLGGFDSRPLSPLRLRRHPLPSLAGTSPAQRRLPGAPAEPRSPGAPAEPRSPSAASKPRSPGAPAKPRSPEAPTPEEPGPTGRSCRQIAGLRRTSTPQISSRGPSGEPKRTPERCGTIEVRVAIGPLVWIEVTPKPTGEHSINDKKPFCGHSLQRS
jgi:hypothetical protein